MPQSEKTQISDQELDVFILELFTRYGYDFRHYARASLKRRIARLIIIDRLKNIAELTLKTQGDKGYVDRVVEELTVNVTEMFRDPELFKIVREKIIPLLATHPFIRIWHAGCASGEEVYSMAILLHEANVLHKSLLYATDINGSSMESIRKGVFSLSHMRQFSENYIRAGGVKDFSSYYTTTNQEATFDSSLNKNIIVAMHNLVSDRSFNEFQLIFCRNVLIYFDKDLQNRVLSLFDESLDTLGFLVLGAKENLRDTDIAKKFVPVHNKEKIWRKIKS